jgi:hypothetical protein
MFCLDDLDVFSRQKPLLYGLSNSLLNQRLRTGSLHGIFEFPFHRKPAGLMPKTHLRTALTHRSGRRCPRAVMHSKNPGNNLTPNCVTEGTALFPRLCRLNLHQNPAETLHIRQPENGLKRSGGRSHPTPRGLASPVSTDALDGS